MEAAANAQRRPVPRSANSSASPDRHRAVKQPVRPDSAGSDNSSASSNVTSLSIPKRSPYDSPTGKLPSFANFEQRNHSNSSLGSATYPRPSVQYMPHDPDTGHRRTSPLAPSAEFSKGHRPRQHSQGFFEPSLPSASLSAEHANMSGLTASQIAAQAAFQHQNMASHARKRSQTVPNPQEEAQQ